MDTTGPDTPGSALAGAAGGGGGGGGDHDDAAGREAESLAVLLGRLSARRRAEFLLYR